METTATGGARREGVRAWWHREVQVLRAGDGRAAQVLRWLYSRPAVVLLPAAAVGPGFFGAAIPGGDAGWFRRAGLSMLGPEFFEVFSSAGLQIGPLYLLGVGVLSAVVEALGLPLLFTVAAAQSVALTAYTLAMTRRFATELGAPSSAAAWGVGAPVVFLGVLAESIGNGHPEEMLVGLLLAHALLAVRSRRPGTVGVLLGIATGLKLWGVLGAPVTLLGRKPRTVLVAGALGVAITALCYLPFQLLGDVNTFDFSWGAGPAPFGFRVPSAALGGWGFRVFQAGTVLLLGGLVAWRWPGVGFGVVLTIVTTRIVLDPLLQMYYPIPFIVVALLWAWTSPRRPDIRWQVAVFPGTLVAMVGPYLLSYPVRIGLTHVTLVAITVAVVRRDRHLAPVAVPGVAVPGEALPGEPVPGEVVPGEAVPGEPVPGEVVPGEAVPGEPLPADARAVDEGAEAAADVSTPGTAGAAAVRRTR